MASRKIYVNIYGPKTSKVGGGSSKNIVEQTCSAKNGTTCSSNQQCTGQEVSSSDGACCLEGDCITQQEQNICEGVCQSSCDSNQESGVGICSNNAQSCCIEKTSSGINWFWIILLIILIILVVLAIIFRDKVRVWWFKFRGKAKTTPITKPGSGTGMPLQFNRPRPVGPFGPRPVQRVPSSVGSQPRLFGKKPVNQKDKEMEETLKKLREMAK